MQTMALMGRVCGKKELQLQGASSYVGNTSAANRMAAMQADKAGSDGDNDAT
jgi:hypothetical protein